MIGAPKWQLDAQLIQDIFKRESTLLQTYYSCDR